MTRDTCGCPISTCGTFHQPECPLYMPPEDKFFPAEMICASCSRKENELRHIAGALGEFYGAEEGAKTVLEKIKFLQKELASFRRKLDREKLAKVIQTIRYPEIDYDVKVARAVIAHLRGGKG
jgi:hypothetical protein